MRLARGDGELLYDALIVGAGFSGALLGRILARNGWRILLVDRQRHPRFALGESTTPLANLSLERLGRLYDLPDLVSLSTHGRWMATFPEVVRGLKRGFSFYRHEPGRPWGSGRDGTEARLLVAASPNDRVADTHWLRADVDRLFSELAIGDGVELCEETVVESIDGEPGRWRLVLRRGEDVDQVEARLLVDASGRAGAVARRLGVGDGRAPASASALLYGHFRGVGALREMIPEACRRRAPYPEERAAVHHLIDEGWVYSLRFDDDRVSAGILLADPTARSSVAAGGGRAAAQQWREILSRYPSLEELLAEAAPLRELGALPRVQHRLAAASGRGWVALPHTFGFVDPLFSTGIAWSLRAVERLVALLLSSGPRAGDLENGVAFERYADLLARELEQVDRLVAPAYAVRRQFPLFAAHALLYFAIVSFAEAKERLCPPPEPWWSGLLGAGEERIEALLAASGRRLSRAVTGARAERSYERWVRQAIAPFDVAGFSDVQPLVGNGGRCYPVDLSVLVANASKLGLEPTRVREALPRLRGAAASEDDASPSRSGSVEVPER